MTISVIEYQNKESSITKAQVRATVEGFFAQHDCTGRRILIVIPDNTRSGPIGDVFKVVFDLIGKKAKALDCLVALGTHQPLTQEQICTRLGITASQRQGRYASVRLFNHDWQKADAFASIGIITADEIEKLSGGLFREQVDVRINKLIFDYDEFFILGPVFPHEVVGFSGGHKYIFPGIAGEEIINFFHWLGAVITNMAINGNKWTATRQVVEKAASFIKMPHYLFAIVSVHNQLNGLFIGGCVEAWEKAADLSSQIHVAYKDKPYHTILSIAPQMYDDMWTAAKAMYKLEPVAADGGTIIVYAPHITEVSYTHGKILDEIGYHVRDYFLKQPERFADTPRAAMAHSTHLKGVGTYENGIEKPRIKVILATGISRQRCEKIDLGYMNPEDVKISNYENKENQGILCVHHAGEVLYRLAGSSATKR